MFILGDSIVKNVNGYVLTKKLRNKKLIKVRSFSGAKVSCIYDHVKPTIRKFNPNHIKVVGQLVRYQGQSLTLHCP